MPPAASSTASPRCGGQASATSTIRSSDADVGTRPVEQRCPLNQHGANRPSVDQPVDVGVVGAELGGVPDRRQVRCCGTGLLVAVLGGSAA